MGAPYAGRREGLILVVQAPPITTHERSSGADQGFGGGEDGDDRAEETALQAGSAVRRAELADFLRARRAALRPEDVGLAGGGRRRTPGLRREELAQLSGVGTTWYTWLEQGRDVRASLSVLESLARALRLTPAERTHLMLLGRGEDGPPPALEPERVSPALRGLIKGLGPNPAYLLGRRWDFLCWNAAGGAVFGELGRMPSAMRNQVWLTFMHPAWRDLFPHWEEDARRIVGKFRADYAGHGQGDPCFEGLLERLMAGSSEFREFWARHEVLGTGEGRKILSHPEVGCLRFEHAVFRHAETPEQRLVLYSPHDAETEAKLAALMGSNLVATA
jgi:transcriptional regulator with XRE-family HTH domain